MNQKLLNEAYDILGGLTPMLTDCGALCGAACCQPDEDGQGGVHLFPGERERLENFEWVINITPDAFAPVMTCAGRCDREHRPLGCRIFPLSPVRGRDSRWTVRLDARARAMCPLVSGGIQALNPAFTRAARDALRCIARDPEGEAFLEGWQALEEAFRTPLW